MLKFDSEKPEGEFNVTSYTSVQLTELTNLLLRNYLYRLYLSESCDEKIVISKVISFHSADKPIPRLPLVNFDTDKNCYLFPDPALNFSAAYKNEKYELCFIIMNEGYDDYRPHYSLHITGISENADRVSDLANLVYNEALKNSHFRNKVISLNIVGYELNKGPFLEGIKVISPSKRKLDDIFISEFKKEHIERFIYAVKNYRTDKIRLRYLFSGPPGTGKTQLMNAMIKILENECTIVLTQGGNFPIEEIFNFCSLFEQCVLVIDDVDFIVSDRKENHNNETLGAFLQYLDGFLPSDVFILASTNEKKLVDTAASRPGRFDLIIDMSEINSDNYLSLIYRETNDPDIISLFNNEIMDTFKSKNVTGAFIVSLITQLTSLKKMKGSIVKEDLKNYFNIIHRGYYSSNAENYNEVVGFNN